MRFPGIAVVSMIVAIFIGDMLTPLGVVIWILYLAPLLIASQKCTRTWNIFFLSLCSILILVGYRLSPPDPFPEPYLYNRLIAVLLMWMTSFFLMQQRQAKARIQQLNDLLQEKVEQLEISNQDLKSFCYTVSHDIRAPLVRVSGFTSALIEDYSCKVDSQGKMYMERIVYSCTNLMKSLDSMLDLSKLSFSSLNVREVNLSDIAQSVVQALTEEQPERQVGLFIAPHMIVQGDGDLLRMVLENLLGNAWKFTTRKQGAKIEFGALEQAGKPVYFVRDNGAGFDEAYADKLFIPFQRLHSSEDFPGTGVGLASVQKIVQRHGGKVWAEGAIGKGATFYFTLQHNEDHSHYIRSLSKRQYLCPNSN